MKHERSIQKESDVIVIGGGPAGSTMAARLAEKGLDVILFDKDVHPRFHIGESLLPRNLPILEQLGVLDEVEKIAVKKYGADLALPDREDYQKFEFAEANKQHPHAFQVKRAEFDHLLLQNAFSKGAQIIEGSKVTGVSFDEEDIVLVTTCNGEGVSAQWRARFVVDASGRDTFLAGRMKTKERDPNHNSAAVFAHFEGVQRRPGADAGNTSVTWFDNGWFWTIPLSDNVDSVGLVCDPEFLKTRTTPLDQFLTEAVASCPQMKHRMSDAHPISETQAAGNFSYKSNTMHGDRFLMIGDAYAFLDPMFSTGIYLAMEGAMQGADAVHTFLHDTETGRLELNAHVASMELGLGRLSWFIYKFNTPAMRKLFMSRLNPLNMRQQVISLLAGDVFERSSGGIGVPAFKAAHRVLSMVLR